VWQQPHIIAAFPDVAGKTVLELGSWNGKWGFLAEERGAQMVVMTDFVCWGRGPLCPEREKALANASYPYSPGAPPCGMREPFDLARAARKSKVRAIEIDPFDLSLRNLGRCFDVVLYPGIMYHVLNQEMQLMRIFDVLCEGGLVFVEGPDAQRLGTVDFPEAAFECTSRCDSHETPYGAFVNYKIAGNNKWFMSVAGVTHLLRSTGFEDVVVSPQSTMHRAMHTARRRTPQSCRSRDCT